MSSDHWRSIQQDLKAQDRPQVLINLPEWLQQHFVPFRTQLHLMYRSGQDENDGAASHRVETGAGHNPYKAWAILLRQLASRLLQQMFPVIAGIRIDYETQMT